MKRCALLTCEDLEGKILDEHHLEKALTRAGWDFEWIPWTREGVDWDQFQCAIIRTTWDYTEDLPRFLKQMQKISESSCRLFNEYSTLLWNSQKAYLKKLNTDGIPVIPTLWLTWTSEKQIPEIWSGLKGDSVIIKPQAGAGSKNTFHCQKSDSQQLHEAFSKLRGVDVMVQPFMEKVVSEGEHSAHFFANQFSHMVLKTPKSNDFRSQEEFGSHVRKVEITNPQENFCHQVLQQIPETTLYARVDFINDEKGEPCLIELELIEPSLYFRYDSEAGVRMVAALDHLMKLD